MRVYTVHFLLNSKLKHVIIRINQKSISSKLTLEILHLIKSFSINQVIEKKDRK